MPTATVEDYLKNILLAEPDDEEELVGMGRLAAAMELAPGTVTSMVKTLSESGLVDYRPYSGVRLTEAGRTLALRVLRRHRLVELFLVQVMGMGWSEVHPEAERLEHAISDRLIERMDEMLGRPAVDPHGDPIPTESGEVRQVDLPSLAVCPDHVPVRVARVTDQDPRFLRRLESQGLVPGTELTVAERDAGSETLTLLDADDRPVRLDLEAASRILVEEAD